MTEGSSLSGRLWDLSAVRLLGIGSLHTHVHVARTCSFSVLLWVFAMCVY